MLFEQSRSEERQDPEFDKAMETLDTAIKKNEKKEIAPGSNDRHFTFNEEAIRAEGKMKGWTGAEIEAKIIFERAKIEAANRKVSGEAAVEAEEDVEASISREFRNRYDNDPEFRKSVDEQQKKREEAA